MANAVVNIEQSSVYEIMYKLANGKWAGRIPNRSALLSVLMEIPTNDFDAAHLLYETFQNRVHYNGSSGWYEWNGTVHELDRTDTLGTGLVGRYIRALEAVKDSLTSEILSWAEVDDQSKGFKDLDSLISYLDKIKGNSGTKGLSEYLRSMFKVDNNYFDGDQNWIVMSDGTVIDLAMTLGYGELAVLDPDPARPVTRKLGVTVDEDTSSVPVEFLRLLRATVSNDDEVRYLQVSAGAAIMGTGRAKNIPHLVGPPHTFKSVYLNVLDEVFGTYSGTLPATALVARYGGGTNFAQSRARGVRFLWLSEPQTTRTDDAFLKNLSGGGEPINTEEKGKDSVAWYAQCVLHIAANHVLRFDSRDSAIVSRMNIVEFHNQVAEKDINPRLAEQLVEREGEEIFMWALQGAIMYSERGSIEVPQSVKDRAQAHVVGSSQPMRWLEEMQDMGEYVISPGVAGYKCIKVKEGFQAFRMWCMDNMEDLKMNQATWLAEVHRYLKTPPEKQDMKARNTRVIYGLTTPALISDGPMGETALVRPVESGGKKWSDLVE